MIDADVLIVALGTAAASLGHVSSVMAAQTKRDNARQASA
jgi:hypothetical protein